MHKSVIMLAVISTVGSLACGDQVTDANPEQMQQLRDTTAVQAKIAFASSRGARWQWPDIYLANSDGSGLRRVTVGTSPAWSWDGQKIAFFRDDNPYDRRGIYVMNADGSGERFVTVGWNPAWSPDGRLAFEVTGIAIINADGSGFRRIVTDAWARATGDACVDPWNGPYVDDPAWSPDGRQIAFLLACYEEWSKIYLVNADGSDPRLLVDRGFAQSPAWSPDGSRIAADIGGVITTIDIESGARADLYSTGVYYAGRRLDWSPDSREIVFDVGDDPDVRRIFILTLETGEVRQLIPNTYPDFYSDFDVAWSRVKSEH